MKKIFILLGSFMVMLSCSSQKKSSKATPAKIQDCPEALIINKMPQISYDGSPAAPSQYYIYKGERHEIEEFDEEWVKKNCNVRVNKVY